MSEGKDKDAQEKRFLFGGGRDGIVKVARAKDTRGTMNRLWRYVGIQKAGLLGVCLLVAATVGFGLMGPYLMGKAIDNYIIPGNLEGLGSIAALMLLVYLVTSFTTWLQTYLMIDVAQKAVRHIRNDLFAKFQVLSLRYFDRHSHGELMSRVSNDVENISNILTESVIQFVTAILTMLGVGTVMFMINARLAIVSLAIIPLMVLVTRWMAVRTREGYRRQQEALGGLNSLIEETIAGERVVKSFCRETASIEAFEDANEKYRESATLAQTYMVTFSPLTGFINNLGFVLVACSGGIMAVMGIATVGTIATFIGYSRHFSRPVVQIGSLFNTIQSALAGAERVFEVLDEVPELTDVPDALPIENLKGDVVFDNVTFGYKEGEPVLNNVNLRVFPGSTVALVGPTGAGKTTIINLLTRFYDIDEGSISIDGKDIRTVQKDTLRRKLGIVLQDSFLFSGSVMDNIRYGRLGASDDEVMAAAELSGADQFILRLPDGYETLLTERGNNLSQGQRQLLSIARAILANPRILILDEATSSVDTRTEIHIQRALLKLMEGRTSFVIAHRLSTIRDADNVLVVDNGAIIEQGNHHDLLDQKGFYYNLYMSQFKGQAAEISIN